MIVVSPCFYPSKAPASHLLTSAKRFGWNVHLYGVGEKWPGFIEAKIFRAIKELKRIEDDTIAFIDSNDVIIQAPPVDVQRLYQDNLLASAPMVVGSEVSCYPRYFKCHFFNLSNVPTGGKNKWLFRYPCPGVVIGDREYIIQAMERMAWWYTSGEMKRLYPQYADCDQTPWVVCWLTGDIHYKIDYHCELSIALNRIDSRPCRGWPTYELDGSGIRRAGSSIVPCFAHFNGGAKTKLMGTVYEALGFKESE